MENFDFESVASFFGEPILAVEIALPVRLNRTWPWESRVRTNVAVLKSDKKELILSYGLTPDTLMLGIEEDNPSEGYLPSGSLRISDRNDEASPEEKIDMRIFGSISDPLEFVDLCSLFPDAGRIYVPDATAVEVLYRQIHRDSACRFDVSGIRIFSSEATTVMDRANGAVIECAIES